MGCYLGQLDVFDQASITLEKLTGIALSDKQIERLTHHYGQRQQATQGGSSLSSSRDKLHYAMVDGSMLLTREKNEQGQCKWAEMKLGRVFSADAHLCSSESPTSRHWIKQSEYVAHLGDCDAFFERITPVLDPLDHLIFVADGASWIWERVGAYYPQAVQILDFFHAVEHLWKLVDCCGPAQFATLADKKQWVDRQKEQLLNDQVGQVIRHIAQLKVGSSKAKEEKRKLLVYYQNNQHRMQYGQYQQNGWLIGSGPIESAHREVIQKRMKRSGQRWTIPGAQQVANLRVAYQSNHWQQVVDDIKLCA